MMEIFKFTETNFNDCPLAKLSKEINHGPIDIDKLDKPLMINNKIEYLELDIKEEKKGLTEEDKAKIKEETGWSDEIIDAIGSMKEYEIYKKADLQEAEINGKKCLIRSDIDMDQKDEFGRTNRERMQNGQPPLTKNGDSIELHHIGQKADSPLAELTKKEHMGGGNDTILHDKQKESEIDRDEFKKERQSHWVSRANE